MRELYDLIDKAAELDLSRQYNCELTLDVCRHVLEKSGPDRVARAAALRVKSAAQEQALRLNSSEWMGMYWQASKVAAQHGDFDSYMLYLERNRPFKKRFYRPRRKILLRAVKDIQALLDGELDEVFLSMPPRVGKALADDTPILTRNGWKPHGDLVVGDEVIGMNGEFKKVIAVHPKCQLDVLVEFTNGEKIQCHENHEWKFYDRASSTEKLKETRYWEKRTLEVGTPGKRGHRYVLQLPERGYVAGEEKDLFDPYTLGVWLGDGANKNPRIANDEKDRAIIDKVVSHGFDIRWQTAHKQTGVVYYDFDIRKQLQTYGMCHSRKRMEKHIPEDYLTASVEQRLELLAGLIDTDGCLVDGNRYQFSTCDIELRDTFVQLVSTFGWRVGIVVHDAATSSSGVVGKKPTYAISFCPDCQIPCALERKQIKKFATKRAISVKSITRVAPKQGNCISVEGDGMYLAGETMIPTHNTTLLLFLVTFIIGLFPEWTNLYTSYSDSVTKAFYNGILEIIRSMEEYSWEEVFPMAGLIKTYAKEEGVDIGRDRRYHSITCRSIKASFNGVLDVSGIAICDDLLKGIEEARNASLMDKTWDAVDNNLVGRLKNNTRILWCGTRWAEVDPIGRRLDLLSTDGRMSARRYSAIILPALDENDESNFDFDPDFVPESPDDVKVGFSTETYHQRRASFERSNDIASWLAQYMGQPVDRTGALFAPEVMRFYDELPAGEPDDVLMHVDPAFGGGDFLSGPVGLVYGKDVYLADVIFSTADKFKTRPRVATMVQDWEVNWLQVEQNNGGEDYAEAVEGILEEREVQGVNITSRPAPNTTSKVARICDAAPEILRFWFPSARLQSKEFRQFMQNLYSFSPKMRNVHDDAADSLAALAGMVRGEGRAKPARVRVFKRPF